MKTYSNENAVEKAVVEFMQAGGWRATRNHVGLFTTSYGGKIKIGTEGFPDWTFTRRVPSGHATVNLMHFEAKAPGKKPTAKQHEVMASLNSIGELAVWADSLERFKSIYYMYFSSEYTQ